MSAQRKAGYGKAPHGQYQPGGGTGTGNMIKAKLNLDSFTPILLHADTLSDPLSDEAKAFKRVSSKRTKTDSDHEDMARMEYMAGLYLGNSGQVVIPSRNLVRCLIEGARITKSGPKVERGLVPLATDFDLDYDGPVTPDDLYSDKRFVSRMTVRVGTARTVRCRPIFKEWGLEAEVMIDETVLSLEDLADIARNSGQMIGLGDYRKGGGFGRFQVEVSQLAA